LDIQDLWPEAFEMVIPIPYLPKLAFWPLRLRANRIYASADAVVSVSETYIDRVRSCGVACEHMKAVYLGTDLSKFDAYRESIVILSKKEGDIWLSYVGTLGHSYDLITVFDALDHLKNHPLYEKIKFIVAGDGPLRQTFEEYAKSKELPVEFTGRLPYPEMVSALCMCDIAVNPIKKKSAGSIINKHGDYAAAGIPVLNTQESAEYRSLVDTYGMGLNCECENARDVADKLTELLESEAKRVAMGQNARRCAEERFDRAGTYRHIVQMIEQI
jgi:glycosyltransferase involved in cell wall biosynthesis